MVATIRITYLVIYTTAATWSIFLFIISLIFIELFILKFEGLLYFFYTIHIKTLIGWFRVQKWIIAKIQFSKCTSSNAIIISFSILISNSLDYIDNIYKIAQVHVTMCQFEINQWFLCIFNQFYHWVCLFLQIYIWNSKSK